MARIIISISRLVLPVVVAMLCLPREAEAASEATPVEIRVSMHQVTAEYTPDDEYCIAARDVVDGSTLKLAECDDPKQRQAGTKLWLIDGKYWKSYTKQDLCVEAATMKEDAMLRLRECKRSRSAKKKQKWLFDLDAQDSYIRPKASKSLNVVFSGSSASSGRDIELGKSGRDSRGLETGKGIDWVIDEVGTDNDKDTKSNEEEKKVNDEKKNTCLCKYLGLRHGQPGFYAGTASSSPTAGDFVEIWKRSKGKDRIWCFDAPDKKGYARIHADDNYGVCWQPDCFEEKCHIRLRPCNDSKEQLWHHLQGKENLWEPIHPKLNPDLSAALNWGDVGNGDALILDRAQWREEEADDKYSFENCDDQPRWDADCCCRLFKLFEKDLCIGLRYDRAVKGQPLELKKCDGRDSDQHWCFDQPRDRIHAHGDRNLCWEPKCLEDGCRIRLRPCGDSRIQKWRHFEEGSSARPIELKVSRNFRSGQLCAEYTDNKPREGREIRLKACNSDDEHAWSQMEGKFTKGDK